MRRLVALVVCLFLGSCAAKTNEEIFYENYMTAFSSSGIPFNETLVFDAAAFEPQSYNYSCTPLPDSYIDTNPTSVHKLTPYNIRVVGAVGDSVTAGFGALAENIFQALTEYRGVSWSIGGDDGYLTVPNLIKWFNSNVKGFSIKTGKATSSNARFNQAVSGAVAEDIPGQVRTLISKIKADSSVNIDEDWKLITIWIGGNDLCAYCNEKEKKSPENYVKYIKEALDNLKENLPRTLVNLVAILDVTQLADLDTGLLCDIVHVFACSCKKSKASSDASHKYNAQLKNLIDQGGYDTTDDFTVVLQPFFEGVTLPQNDPGSYFGLDCFHFSGKGHAEVARALWNNMLSPVGEKAGTIDWGDEPPLKCPTTTYPYIFTDKNSGENFFGAVNPDPNSVPNPASSNFLGIVLGTSLTVFTVAIAIVVSIVAVVYVRRRRRQYLSVRSIHISMSVDTEKTRLVLSQ